MRSIPLTFCAAAVVAATLVPASAALADSESDSGTGSGTDSGSRTTLSATPPSAVPGGDVALRLDACKGKEAKGTSEVFASEALFSPAADGGLIAQARISSDASPGDYKVQIVCTDDKDTKASGTVTVIDRDQATPLAPVSAGGGGTAPLTEQEAHQDGPGIVHAVVGLALAAVAVVAVAFRSARRRRPATD
ncbi:hypothetical protein [Streptomyces sp. NBC_01217]|uniref:hypothetical protein n=1 Tax=Streptomyces sp. NBC_01217 TaxID=2903779 RepID=UPI002E13C414|nr:hypothetical protein OG507_14430 [Streptomyces sp. NBC_01217]